MIKIFRAQIADLDLIIPLFDKYRVFYEQESDLIGAAEFLRRRIDNNESIIFLAAYNKIPVGFTQLYTSFSSVSMKPIYILNDLYVDATYRKKGIGEALLNEAKMLCKKNGFKGLALETAIDNPAQKLYEHLGWKKDSACFHYFWKA